MKTIINKFTQLTFSALLTLLPLRFATADDCYLLSPGCLDVTFGGGMGKVVVDLSPGTDANRARGVAIQADWKIVAAGTTTTPGTLKHAFALLRFNIDGSLDSTFGNGGVVTTSFSTGNDDGWAVAIQADGKIVVVGSAYAGQLARGSSQYVFAVSRYNPLDGSLDSTFGNGGKTTVGFGNNSQTADTEARAVAIQPDGKILVGGFAGNSGAIARLNSNGSLDATFASGGKLTSSINAGPSAAVVIQSDGKIVFGGWMSGKRTGYDFALARYNSNGSTDTAFGNGGVATADFFGLEDRIRALAMDGNNNIVAAGYASTGSGPTYRNIAVTRFTPSGQLDPSFGNGGNVVTDIFGGWDDCYALAIQVDGKILAGGFGETTNPIQFYFTVLRYNSNGALDSSFGTGGIVATNFAGAPQNYAYALAIQPDGKIVAGGSAQVPPTATYLEAVALARYLP